MLRSLFIVASEAAVSLTRRRVVRVRRVDALSPRQREVLAAVARGRLTKEIARDLGITEATVKTHLARACERLGAATRAQAVARYVASTRR